MKMTNMNKGEVGCNICKLKFSAQVVLNTHLTGHKHKRKAEVMELFENLKNKEQCIQLNPEIHEIMCTRCDVILYTPSFLTKHMDSDKHTGKTTNGSESKPVKPSTGKSKSSQPPPAPRIKIPPPQKKERPPLDIAIPSYVKKLEDNKTGGKYYCNPCQSSCNSDIQLVQHLSSKKHLDKVSAKRKGPPTAGGEGMGAKKSLYSKYKETSFVPAGWKKTSLLSGANTSALRSKSSLLRSGSSLLGSGSSFFGSGGSIAAKTSSSMFDSGPTSQYSTENTAERAAAWASYSNPSLMGKYPETVFSSSQDNGYGQSYGAPQGDYQNYNESVVAPHAKQMKNDPWPSKSGLLRDDPATAKDMHSAIDYGAARGPADQYSQEYGMQYADGRSSLMGSFREGSGTLDSGFKGGDPGYPGANNQGIPYRSESDMYSQNGQSTFRSGNVGGPYRTNEPIRSARPEVDAYRPNEPAAYGASDQDAYRLNTQGPVRSNDGGFGLNDQLPYRSAEPAPYSSNDQGLYRSSEQGLYRSSGQGPYRSSDQSSYGRSEIGTYRHGEASLGEPSIMQSSQGSYPSGEPPAYGKNPRDMGSGDTMAGMGMSRSAGGGFRAAPHLSRSFVGGSLL